MNSLPFFQSPISRRLTPLYLAAFFQSFVLWYTVEKLFMVSIGFTAATIGVMVAAYSLMTLLIETPSGILADRWSRKGILIIASCALAISSIICGYSHSVPMYIVGAGFWGIFIAFYSGTYDSIVYDTLLEEAGSAHDYKLHYGRVSIFESVGLVIGSLLGGLVASLSGLASTYIWSIPFALLSILALILFREPTLHKDSQDSTALQHIKNTFNAVLRRRNLAGALALLVLGAVVSDLVFEFDQLWLMAAQTPVASYGLITALLLSSIGLAGLVAPKLRLTDQRFVAAFGAALLIAATTLILSHSTWPLVIALTFIAVSLLSIDIIYMNLLHDHLPSKVRAGASSTISTISRGLLILLSLGFGWLTQHFSVSAGAWLILLPIAFITSYLLYASDTYSAEK